VTARWLERINADAVSSLREGLEETLAVVRLGLAGALRRTLATTNQSHRVGPLGDAAGDGARDALA